MSAIQIQSMKRGLSLDDYASHAHLAHQVQQYRMLADQLREHFRGRRLWVVNSTASGGGVAEMLPAQLALFSDVGIRTRWVVITPGDPSFFELTKHLHNLIHGHGRPRLGDEQRERFEEVNRRSAEELLPELDPEDLLLVHDPQPVAMGAALKEQLGLPAVWRCHIGIEDHLPATREAWRFLEPYVSAYDRAVFTAAEYIPDYLSGRATTIHPALDPLSHKNRELRSPKLMGILCNSGLARARQPVLTPRFPEQAERLQPDGSMGPVDAPDEIGLMYRPVVTQVSRWDRLKGFAPLLEAFVRLKQECAEGARARPRTRHRRRLQLVRLVLAGPDPDSIQDDPEGLEVFAELTRQYRSLSPELQRDVAVISLPMASRKRNALMVNALQHCSSLVVQNSLQEGFGLTATEAMWKGIPVLGTQAVGLRTQIRDGLDGRLVCDAEDPAEIADALDAMLADSGARDHWGRSARRRVHDEFLVFKQLSDWVRLLASLLP